MMQPLYLFVRDVVPFVNVIEDICIKVDGLFGGMATHQ